MKPTLKPATAQRGVVLLLSVLLLGLSSLAFLYLYNVGQLVSTKMRLNNAADAAAYSAAVWRARVLNFHAYSNRAILAQEVAVAQAITLASWARYFESLRAHAEPQLRAGYPALAPLLEIDAAVVAQTRDAIERAAALEVWLRAAPEHGYKSMLLASQEALQHSAGTFGLGALANEVARANDRHFFAFALPDQGGFEALTQRYQRRDERVRLTELVLESLDEFVREPRSVDQDLVLRDPCAPPAGSSGRQQYRKRGATELSEDLNRWQAADTGSIHALVNPAQALELGRSVGNCVDLERPPVGWGAFVAAPAPSLRQLDGDPGLISDNPRAADRARQQLAARPLTPQPEYDGIARVRELALSELERSAPVRSSLAVLARVDAEQLHTVSLPRTTTRSAFADDRLWALAAAEVYFRRPDIQTPRIEHASLYSPYWQARLVAPTANQRQLANGYAQ